MMPESKRIKPLMAPLNTQRDEAPQCWSAHSEKQSQHSCDNPKEGSMPRFLIERNFAEEVEMTKDDVDRVNRINDETGVKWLISFLSADKKKTYCLYEAPSAEAIRLAAKRANVPADVIIEVTRKLSPTMFD
jgi:hypothetical protein